MQRREFLGATLMAASGAAMPDPASSRTAAPRPPARMKAGHQHVHDAETLKVLASFGVNHICSGLPSPKFDEAWSVDGLKRLRDHVEKHKINLEMVPLPLSSHYITKSETPSIMLGTPDRDRDIDNICQMIRNVAAAGIPAVKYNLTVLGVVRTARTPGRGFASYSTFVYDQAKQEPPLTEAGPMPAERMWERIEYFLKRVVPVATEYKVRMACHPHDPGMPRPKGFRGVDRVLGSVEGLKKFISIVDSPYHGLNFCQGTVSEMLENPGQEIYDIIRYFGERKKIFNVHFRNIKGKFLNFQETFPDDGDVDMLRAMRVYRDVGYDGMIMPDHVPQIPGDERSRQAFAFAFGYIQAAIQMVKNEA
jgi:mannonate dehydratase